MNRMMAILGCLFPFIGAVCIFFPEYVTKGLPYLLGGAMAVDGAAHIAIYYLVNQRNPQSVKIIKRDDSQDSAEGAFSFFFAPLFGPHNPCPATPVRPV